MTLRYGLQVKEVLAFAGRRIDADSSAPRFSLANVPLIRARLCDLFLQLRPSALVCAAACGSDLIALDVAETLGVPARIVLPFAPEVFRGSSVTDRPGDWGPAFDHHIDLARRACRLVVRALDPQLESSYLQANEAILDEAVACAAATGDVRAVIVWDGSKRSGMDVTHAFAQSARRRGIPVIEVLSG